VDTEADSLHAYPEKVCLIQVSTAEGDRLIDPLSKVDLTPFLEALSGHQLIMHGADYDLRLLRKHHDFVPKAIFDTMLAARLLGIRQFSLGNLVEHYLGVKLQKGAQKANWALRPLTERMERYARNDTHFLKPLADCLQGDLAAKGRLDWHKECCDRLIEESAGQEPANPDRLWRMRGSQTLSREGLAILREVWRWREKEAVAANRPPFFILSHDILVDIAASAAAGAQYQRFLPRHFSERRRTSLAKAINHALQLAVDHHPKVLRPTSRRPTEGERRRHQELQKRRDAVAAELGIDPTFLASRAILSDLAHDWEKHSRDLMKWQLTLLAPP
jgi:ribonuclease D